MEERDDSGDNKCNKNPLLHVVVLDHLFSFKPEFEDLKSCRRVCKQWNEHLDEQWREKAVITILQDEEEGNNSNPMDSGITAKEYLQELRENPSFKLRPMRRVKLKNWTFDEKKYERHEASYRLFDQIGKFVEYLNFEGCSASHTRAFVQVFETLVFGKSPKLKKVVFTNCRENDREHPEIGTEFGDICLHMNLKSLEVTGKTPISLKKLVARFPNLEHLKCRLGNDTRHVNTYTMFQNYTLFRFVRNFRRYPLSLTKLKHLDLMQTDFFDLSRSVQRYYGDQDPEAQNRNHELNLLFKNDDGSHPPMETLAVELGEVPFDPDEIPARPHIPRQREHMHTNADLLRKVVIPFASTLKHLKLFCRQFEGENWRPSHDFPFGVEMPAMEELCLWGGVTTNLNFLDWMPNLKVLYINTLCFDKWDDLQAAMIRSRGEQGSHSFRLQPLFESDMVLNTNWSVLGETFTGIRQLHLDSSLSRQSVEVLAKHMPNVKALKLFVDQNETFRVICEKWPTLKELQLLRNSSISNEAVTGRDTESDEKVFAGLVNLNWLTTFGFEFLCCCNPSKLSKKSVYNGFLQMKSLTSVSIIGNEMMDGKAVEDLENAVSRVRVVRAQPQVEPCQHLSFYQSCYSITMNESMNE